MAAMSKAESALRARVARGGVATLPAGTTVLTRTLEISRVGGGLQGAATGERSVLLWKGPPDQPAVRIRGGVFWPVLRDFGIVGPLPQPYPVPGAPAAGRRARKGVG